jgi:hypothetical protein
MSPEQSATTKTIYVTRTGLPLNFQFEWPFRQSTSGVLPSLDKKDTEAPVINALRKDVDRMQIEFLKSAKLVPLHFSSRHYDFKRNQWAFGKASDDEIARLIERKVFWQTKLVGGDVWLGDPTEALYLETTTDHVVEVAASLAERGLFTMARRYATALPALMSQQDRFEKEMAEAIHQLEEKHAFERG